MGRKLLESRAKVDQVMRSVAHAKVKVAEDLKQSNDFHGGMPGGNERPNG